MDMGSFLLNFVSKINNLVLVAGDSMEYRGISISHQYVPTGSICAEQHCRIGCCNFTFGSCYSLVRGLCVLLGFRTCARGWELDVHQTDVSVAQVRMFLQTEALICKLFIPNSTSNLIINVADC